MPFLGLEESQRLRQLEINRKRRLRWIYKWHHGISKRHLPVRGERLRAPEMLLRLDPLAERIIAPLANKLVEEIADALMRGDDKPNNLIEAMRGWKNSDGFVEKIDREFDREFGPKGR